MTDAATPPAPRRDGPDLEHRGLCCGCVLVALAALALTALVARAAPVPPPPPLAEPALAGRWCYEYGHQRGHLWLLRDGTFTARLSADGPIYVGRWWVHRGRLVLLEGWYDPATGRASEAEARYEFAFPAGAGEPGECGGTRVRLSGRVPVEGDD